MNDDQKESSLTESTISSENVFLGKLLDVNVDHIHLSNGHTSVREWIRHWGAAAIVPLFEDGTTILVEQYRYPARKTFLEVPAGKLDFQGEEPLKVARRELEEETGWIGTQWEPLGSYYPCIGYSNEVIHFFLATELVQGEMRLGRGELLETIRMPFSEAAKLARSGVIDDMKTALALRLATDAVVRIDKRFV